MSPGAVLDSMGTAEVVVAQSLAAPTARPRVDVAPGIRSAGTTLLRVVELARNVAWASQDPAVAGWIEALLSGEAVPEPILEAGLFRVGRRGGTAPSYGLGAPHQPRARASAVLGALACAGRDAVDAVQAAAANQSGQEALWLAGGWARNPGWVSIKESVLGYPIHVLAEPEVTAVGAALLAATALGWQPDANLALSDVAG